MVNLKSYFKIADEEAKKSPCVRRQYGCVIVWTVDNYPYQQYVVGSNYRLSDCCNGECARNRADTAHGARVEVGAEIHAETAALINFGANAAENNAHVLLVGWVGNKELRGKDVYPCHTCALNLKFAGFWKLYIRADDGIIIGVTIDSIIKKKGAGMGDSGFVDFFGILEQYKDLPNAPKHLSDLPKFEEECHRNGYHELASWLETWRLNLEYHISREFTE